MNPICDNHFVYASFWASRTFFLLITINSAVLEVWTKKNAHLLDEFQNTFIYNFIVNKVCIFSIINNSLTSKYVQMLGDIGVCGFYLVSDLTDREFSILQ